ncbi:hypothetical protein BJX63DRAFT_265180 [Aspergillus granulosus]|uniref:Uncharacterized protein n=1 Tax=Aspergillus granulosus TaxID=176169 RepID=A0ABR4H8P4_9EURO
MPGISTGLNHSFGRSWYSHCLTDSALHSSMVFGAFAHQRVQSMLGNKLGLFNNSNISRQVMIAQIDSLSKVNRAMQDSAKATSDPMILCVLCLATNDSPHNRSVGKSPFEPPLRSLQWLNIYGTSSPNPVHQAGLARIIELCGGLNAIKLPGLAAVISFSDILGASRSLSRPKFPFVSLGNEGQSILQQISRDEIDQSTLLDLEVTPEMHTALQDARAYVYLVERYIEGVYFGEPTMQIMSDSRNFVQWQIMSLLPMSQLALGSVIPTQPVRMLVYEACRLALITFGVGVIFPLPPQSAPLLQLARSLQMTLQLDADDRSRTGLLSFPRTEVKTRLWCLVLGGIAASGVHEREWFVDELKYFAAEHGFPMWNDIRVMLRSVLWFDGACNSAGEQLWSEVRCFED